MARQSTRKKASNASRITTPIADQTVFVAPRRSVRSRPSAWSAPTKKQQTITQMNPFFSIFHPDTLPSDLSYEDDNTSIPAPDSPRPRKRQKLTPTKVTTRSTATRNSQAVERSLGRENRRPERITRVKTVPKTPIPRDKVIPSSQSPAETPTSTRSRRGGQSTFRSPLHARSVNITPRRSNLRSSTAKISENGFASHWEGRGCIHPTTPVVPFKLPSSTMKSSSRSSSQARNSYSKVPPEAMCVVLDSEKENPPSQASANLQILGLNDLNTDANAIDFDAGTETQEAIASLQSDPFALLTSNQCQTSSQIQQDVCSENRVSSSEVASSNKDPQDEEQSSRPSKPSQAYSDLKETSNSDSVPTLPQYKPQTFSRQIIAQNPQISQGHCHPNDKQIPSIPSSSPPVLSPSPQPQQQVSISSAATTIPTQPLPRGSSHSNPVPPSQATTIDTTQASASRWKRKASTTIPDSSPLEPQASSTRPPPSQLAPSIPSSSPLPSQLEEGDLGAYEWKSGSLHESQLLPESQMQGSLARPPKGWEEWSLEDEE